MAKYRQIYTEFWSDSFIFELTSEEKFFYLYLLSNTKSTQSGIYEISEKFIAIETGYSIDKVEELIERFCDYEKILYNKDTKEIMVLNWIKYNIPNNNNAIIGVQKELRKIKNKGFVKILFEKCKAIQLDVERIFQNIIVEEIMDTDFVLSNNLGEDRLSIDSYLEKVDKLYVNDISNNITGEIPMTAKDQEIQYEDGIVEKEKSVRVNVLSINRALGSPLLGATKGVPSNRIRSNEEEVMNKKQKVISKEEEEEVIKIFEENVHVITPLVYEKIVGFIKQVSSKVVIMAIYEAVSYNAKTMKYITKILNSWISNGIKTEEQVLVYQKQWVNKGNRAQNLNVKSGGFCEYEQRIYDYDILEKQLLGLA